jgi:F-type H+-transporting ATPase subunit a
VRKVKEGHLLVFGGHWYEFDLVAIGTMVLCGLLVLLFLRLALRNLDMRSPRGAQNLVEWMVDFTRGMAKDTMPSEKAVEWIMPLAFTMLVFLFVANWLGLIATVNVHIHRPIDWLHISAADIQGEGFVTNLLHSPTSFMSVTLGLSIMVWIISHFIGIKTGGVGTWGKHLLNPIHLLEEILNPITHGMRLFGNIFAGEVLIGVILEMPLLFGFVPTGFPLLLIWLFYSAFVSTVQAYVFTILLCLYIGNKFYDGSHAHH